MGVGNGEPVIHISLNNRFISVDSYLFYGVFNFFTCFEFVKTREACCPIVCITENNCVPGLLTISHQNYSNICRAYAVLIILVVPYLGNCNISLISGMCIGDIITFV